MSSRLLSCLKKRDFLNAEVFDQRRCLEYAKEFCQLGYLSDAIDFLAKAKADDQLRQLLPQVIEEGDLFLVEKIYRLLKERPSNEDLIKVAERAQEKGKWVFAYKAYQKAGLDDKAKEIKEILEQKGLWVLPQTFLPGTGQEETIKQPKKSSRKKKRRK